MPFELGDIFIGNYRETQAFGARPDVYMARFGLRGHNGLDFGTPTMTPILATAAGLVKEVLFDAGGYGKYIKIVHDGFFSLYAHLNDQLVKVGDRVIKGQLIGHSNNTGFSDAPHLHFGIAPCDKDGNKTERNNGYSGYIDPRGDRCKWTITNPTTPAVQENNVQPPVAVPATDFVRMVAEGTNYKVIRAYVLEHGINQHLQAVGKDIIDENNNPNDPAGGEKVVEFISYLLYQQEQLKAQLAQQPSTTIPQTGELSEQQKEAFITSLLTSIRDFVFTKK